MEILTDAAFICCECRSPRDDLCCTQVLRVLLARWYLKNDKVLIFSYSIRMLNILEKFLVTKGHKYLRSGLLTLASLSQVVVCIFVCMCVHLCTCISVRAFMFACVYICVSVDLSAVIVSSRLADHCCAKTKGA